jgi:hypothetical protein
MEILNHTLRQMPPYFSSNGFSAKAQKNGLTKNDIANGIISNYLKINAEKGNSRRTWYKRFFRTEVVNEVQVEKIKNLVIDEENEITKAIYLLKSKGYKILKPNIEFTEV